MSEDNNISIKPIQTKQYEVKQSKFEACGKLPIRSVILGPSGSGKTILLQNMIMNLYDKCFERVYIFSPSINVDATWTPVKDYIENKMDAHETDDDKFYFDHYDQDGLESIITTQNKIVLEQITPGKSPQNNADIEEDSNPMLYIDSKNKIDSKNSNPQNNNMGFDSAEEQDKCFNTMDTFLTGDLDLLKKEAAGDMGDARITQKYKQLDYKSENREKDCEQKFH